MKVLFMGRKTQGCMALEWLVAQGHDIVGVLTDSHLEGSPTAKYARKAGLRLATLEDIIGEIARGEISFDVGVSFVYWRILPPELIDAATHGVINFHPAPLPEYKGVGGYNLAILDSLGEWGVTAHYVDEGIDTGDIIEVVTFPMDRDAATVVSLERDSMEQMLALFRRTLVRVAESHGRLPARPNGPGRHLTRRELEELKRVQDGDDVDRKIRAFWFPPYSGAFVEILGCRYTLVNNPILQSLTPPGTTSLFAGDSDKQESSDPREAKHRV